MRADRIEPFRRAARCVKRYLDRHDWKVGLVVVGRDRRVSVLFVVLGAAALADSFNSALLVPFVEGVLGDAAREFAWMLTAQAVSGIGAGLLPPVSRVVPTTRLIGLSAAVRGLLFLIAYSVPSLPLVLGLAVLLDVPSVGFYSSTRTLLQQHVADQYLCRVFGALGTTNALLHVTALGLAGACADQVGVRPGLFVVVALWFLTALIALGGLPATERGTGRHPETP